MNFFLPRFDRQHEWSSRARNASMLDSSEEHAPVVRWQRNQPTLKLSSERLRTFNQMQELGQQMLNLLEDSDVQMLRVDLQGIQSISSEALSQFARVHCRASQLGKVVVIENVGDAVREIFRVTRFDRLFGIDDEGFIRDTWKRNFDSQFAESLRY